MNNRNREMPNINNKKYKMMNKLIVNLNMKIKFKIQYKMKINRMRMSKVKSQNKLIWMSLNNKMIKDNQIILLVQMDSKNLGKYNNENF